jgi:hypothetical protein
MFLTMQKNYKPGDPPPVGYLAWHEWAEVQYKAGLRQVACSQCGLWRFPQGLSDKVAGTCKKCAVELRGK